MQLAKKVALITGAASGIGRSAALLFAREGAAIAVADLDAEMANGLPRRLTELAVGPFFERVDVTRAADCQRVAERTIREFGRRRHPVQQRRHHPARDRA